ETQFAMQMLRDQLGQHVFPVHRLDRPTSGALVFALSSEAARLLAEEFQHHRVQKEYLAVVRGIPLKPISVVNHALKEELDPLADKASGDKPPQMAVTEVEHLASVELP